MKHYFNLILSAVMLWTVTACANVSSQMSTPTAVPRESETSKIYGVFQANTPCSAQARPLPQIPAGTECEQMKWNLVLYQDSQTGAPTTYSLMSTYGMAKPNTNDLIDGGTPVEMEGTWTITTGTKNDPEATVYQLNANDSQTTVSFLKVSDDMIHVLSSEKTLLVGNGAWSYTLNRMDNQSPTEIIEESRPDPPTRPPEPAMPAGSSVFAVFDGRTPCHEVVLEFTNTESFPGCLKIKWRLTLYQDSTTGEPSTYLFMGTSQFREGSWRIINGIEGDSDAVVYQLQPDDGQEPVSFLKVDENHLYLMDRELHLLVGNELFSYTLSRVEPGTQ
jgi:hypothetical protein